MGVTVHANNLSIVHKGSDGICLGFPDVCLTPPMTSNPSGVPIPYPNIASREGARTGVAPGKVKTATKPTATKSAPASKLTRSVGDEAGTRTGIKSASHMGGAAYRTGASNVKFEGSHAAVSPLPLLNAPPPVRCANPACTYHSAGIPATQTAMLPADVEVEFSPRVVCLTCYRDLVGREPMPAAGG